MTTLSVWRFDTATGADDASRTLRALHDGALVTVHDAAIVSWEIDDRRPKTRNLDAPLGALGGAFWGFLFGLIFFVPLLGTVVGLTAGALSATVRSVGIDEAFINRVRESVTPGSSALFVLSSDAVIPEVRKAFAGVEMELIETNLSEKDERALRATFTND